MKPVKCVNPGLPHTFRNKSQKKLNRRAIRAVEYHVDPQFA